ncbi:Quaternary ammonium compound-resistance protein SugE [Photorhabdus australis subsp. thailandensis]|uniref:Guanidinium exporter n=2 Tax=Photorhabdus australis TaxID=286156 RepID=A0A1C0U3J6_9GAMM|nr:Quaternary ammonium compound-resistance protein SugE [Photorhabdus australis subsp. thailandensis]
MVIQDDLNILPFLGDDPTTLCDVDMSWFILVIAGLFEVVWAVGLKYTHGFTRLVPSLITVSAIALSMGLLAYAMKGLPVGTAYGVWTGIGAVGTAIFGIIVLGESASIARVLSIVLIVAGIIGLKLTS